MSTKTGIEWTDATWNPIRGCSPVSPGCKNCYASKIARRFSGPGGPYEGLVRINAAGERTDEWNGVLRPVNNHLLDPLKWKPVLTGIRDGEGELRQKEHKDGSVTVTRERPRRIFVNSMSDLFHEDLPDDERAKVFAVMSLCPQHEFQVLTKRAEIMSRLMSSIDFQTQISIEAAKLVQAYWPKLRMMPKGLSWNLKGLPAYVVGQLKFPLPNVWLGVSVENQKYADERGASMAAIAARGWKTFVSYEPALGPVLWGGWEFIKWFISGGESGLDARPSHPDWHRIARDFCLENSIPFFFKQWGEYLPAMCDGPEIDGATELNCSDEPVRVGKKAAGALLDGREWHEFPEVPVCV
jgi:protein gp37